MRNVYSLYDSGILLKMFDNAATFHIQKRYIERCKINNNYLFRLFVLSSS